MMTDGPREDRSPKSRFQPPRMASTDSDYRAGAYLRPGASLFIKGPGHLRFKPSEPSGHAFDTGCVTTVISLPGRGGVRRSGGLRSSQVQYYGIRYDIDYQVRVHVP